MAARDVLARKRKGLTLAEIIICTLVLAVVTIGVVSVGNSIAVMKTETRNSVFLSIHNLNVAEQLRQMLLELPEGQELAAYYGASTDGNVGGIAAKDPFSTRDITTRVFLSKVTMDTFDVYSVRVESQMRGYYQTMTDTFTMTNIGGHLPGGSLENPEESSPVLEG